MLLRTLLGLVLALAAAGAEAALQAPAFGFTLPLDRVAQARPQSQNQNASGGDVETSSAQGFSYLASLSVGAQNLKLILDTGSSDLWVVSTSCLSPDCASVPSYAPSPSLLRTTHPFSLSYLQGSASGLVAYETVSLGPYQISNQSFALADNTRGLGLAANGASGILGLGFPPTAAIPGGVGATLGANLFAFLPPDQRYFAFALGRNGTAPSLSIGALDASYASSLDALEYTPVFVNPGGKADYWKLPLRAITLNGTSSSTLSSFAPSRVKGSDAPIAVLDTGTTFVLGPSADVDALWGAIGAARKSAAGIWEVRCARGVSVGFVLGGEGGAGREYALDPSDVSWVPSGSEGGEGWCVGGIQASDGVASGDWILGDTFLRNVYATHHGASAAQPPRIGLLSLTDPPSALTRFRAERGADPTAAGPGGGGTVLAPRARKGAAGPALLFVMLFVGCFVAGVAGGWGGMRVRGRHAYGVVGAGEHGA